MAPVRARLVLAAALCAALLAVPPLAAQMQESPDERPYDSQLLRLSEILGAIHYLRELCGANEGQLWRDQMSDLVRAEGGTAIRRARLVRGFNQGYRGYSRTYRTCNESALLAIERFMEEGARLSQLLAQEGG